MEKKKKKQRDIAEIAYQTVQEATQEQPTDNIQSQKNPAAVSLGRLGGLKGGPARAKSLSKKELREWGQKTAKARWSKKS
jgi:methenyltetrahydromethanopterin cyclohydrolase